MEAFVEFSHSNNAGTLLVHYIKNGDKYNCQNYNKIHNLRSFLWKHISKKKIGANF
jgi:hypothetical protein